MRAGGKARALVIFLILSVVVANTSAQQPSYPLSDHYDGKRFHNLEKDSEVGSFEQWRFRFGRFTNEVGRLFTRNGKNANTTVYPPPPRAVADGRVRVTLVGHATVLVQMGGVNILTDPIWSERVGPFSWAGPKRVRPPGIKFEDLPPIHAVVISHNHYDHLDIRTLRRLAREHRPRFFVGLGNARLLSENKIGDEQQVTELDWWQSDAVAGDGGASVRVTFVPARHWSGRGLRGRNETLWGGYVFEAPSTGAIYFAGDTAFGSHFGQIARKFPSVRLALFPVGAYLPRRLMQDHHISPVEAVCAALLLGARTSVGMHFGTFDLSDDGTRPPVDELRQALETLGAGRESFLLLEFGEGREVTWSFAPE